MCNCIFRNAKLKNNLEVTSTSIFAEDINDRALNQIGIQLAYGVTPKLDVKLRYRYLWSKFDD
jgi:hypothetical protein